MTAPFPRRPAALPVFTLAVLAALVAVPAAAQYKVIGTDGKVTYTDRAPSPREGKVSTLGARGDSAATDSTLPLELRQAAGRYPVTLYAAGGACEPCDAARALLRQRGVPFNEKLVTSGEDTEALQRLTGGREAPTLMVGAQVLRGLATDVWNSYLDSAGYPRESRLPQGYQYPAPTPLTERKPVAAPTPPAVPAPATTPATPETSIRF